jgi:hypothetical protein
VLWADRAAASPGFPVDAFTALAALALALLFVGEILERYLFFVAVVAPKMPGSPAS